MVAFRGSFTAKVEDGGRLKLPGPYKKLLDEANVTEFYITSDDGLNAQIWPLPEWEKREARLLAETSDMVEVVNKYLEVTSRYGLQTEMDKQARVTLPLKLRTAAKLEGEVTISGMLNYMRVQNSEMAEESASTLTLTAEDRKLLAPFFRPPSVSDR